MQQAIDKNKLRYIRANASRATFEDLLYAYNEGTIEALWLLFDGNAEFKKALKYRCFYKLDPDEYEFLGGLDPKDMANDIRKMSEK